ncbi:hypothetical protein HML84_07370 [Alcanivorax sp. IO_7]|nr:hypothetical protein HML84_07370 [Alcanivorax sp. IO_7]
MLERVRAVIGGHLWSVWRAAAGLAGIAVVRELESPPPPQADNMPRDSPAVAERLRNSRRFMTCLDMENLAARYGAVMIRI